MTPHFELDFTFPHHYEVKLLSTAPPVHPVEKVHHYPMELEEGDRAGAYVRVAPSTGAPWTAFFALGFDSPQVVNAICSCPDPDSLCAVVGGYAYVVYAADPAQWFRVEQRPVVDLRALARQGLLLFTGFTSISAVGREGLQWTTGRLSWEGVSITGIADDRLTGLGWDAMSDKEVAFEVDLLNGKHTGGARPGNALYPSRSEGTL
jgi:hypothetical protein